MKPGHVPVDRVGPIIAALIAERWPHGGGFNVLAEKIGCDEATIASIAKQKNASMAFDLADSLLCALGRPDVWCGELADVYFNVDLATLEPLPTRVARFRCSHAKTEDNLVKNGVIGGVRVLRCKTCNNARKRRHRELVAA